MFISDNCVFNGICCLFYTLVSSNGLVDDSCDWESRFDMEKKAQTIEINCCSVYYCPIYMK